jgi:uncharacterized protein YggT (Ycf19 family)
MPNTGAIDFSPMVLVVILQILGGIVIPRLYMVVV